jgi:hypothetical protein
MAATDQRLGLAAVAFAAAEHEADHLLRDLPLVHCL